MKTIRVDTYAKIIGYKTFGEAIAAANRHPRKKRSDIDTSLIRGAFITDFTFSDSTIQIRFDNHRTIELSSHKEFVDWRVFCAEEMTNRFDPPCQPPMRLIWPRGSTTEWNVAVLLESRRPFPLQQIFGGDFFVDISFEGGGSLMFTPLWNLDDQRCLIHIEEDEPIGPPRWKKTRKSTE